jgi:hypothetical protein
MILIWTLDHNQFDAIIAQAQTLLEQRPTHEPWLDLVLAI